MLVRSSLCRCSVCVVGDLAAFGHGAPGRCRTARNRAPCGLMRRISTATGRSAPTARAADGRLVAGVDSGWSQTSNAVAAPGDYFDLTFSAPANTPYHVWFRLRAGSDSKYNDSVYAQFSDAVDGGGSSIFRIGSAASLVINLQRCNGCALSGWGWIDGAYWLSQTSTLSFASTGTHTLRVQTREDGVAIDQVVLSPALYLSAAPGSPVSDNTIIPKGPPLHRAPRRRSPGRPARFPARFKRLRSILAGRAWRITTRRRATAAARFAPATSISNLRPPAGLMWAGSTLANG